MKKLTLLFLGVACTLISVFAQEKEEVTDPDEQIIVNKEYDENGNLLSYDSTYINKWSSDTTLDFSFDDKLIFGDGFRDIDEFFEKFFNDSVHQGFGFQPDFDFSPFNNEDFFDHFGHAFPDSSLSHHFNFNMDSLGTIPRNFVFPDLNELQKQMQKQFRQFEFPEHSFPQGLNDDQIKELKELQKKHQEEMEELKKKWKEE